MNATAKPLLILDLLAAMVGFYIYSNLKTVLGKVIKKWCWHFNFIKLEAPKLTHLTCEK